MNPPSAPQGSTQRARLLLVLLGVVWGLNWPAVKIALSGLSPWMLRSIGLGAAALTVFALGLARGRSLAVRSGRERMHIAVAGVLNVAAFNILLTFAQLGAATSRVAILTYSMPLWATLLARLFLGERLAGLRAGGLLLGAAGLAVLLWPLAMAGAITPGILLALAAAICWASGTVYTKRARLNTEPLVVAAWQLFIGATVAIIGLLSFEGWPHWPHVSGAVWLALAYHIVFGMALGYLLWFDIVTRMPAGAASLGTLLVPVVGVSGAVLLLGEHPGMADLAGFALIFAAALCVLLPGRPARLRAPHATK